MKLNGAEMLADDLMDRVDYWSEECELGCMDIVGALEMVKLIIFNKVVTEDEV